MKIPAAFIIFLPLFSFSLAAPAREQDAVSKRRIFNYEPDLSVDVEARHSSSVSSSPDTEYKRNKDTSLGVEYKRSEDDELDREYKRNEDDDLEREYKRNEDDGLEREYKRSNHGREDNSLGTEFRRIGGVEGVENGF